MLLYKLFRHSKPTAPSSDPEAGTLGMPVEIWQEIFILVDAITVAPASLENELFNPLSTISPLVTEYPGILSEFHDFQSMRLFANRYSFVLVCKSWYSMGISRLWSHLCLNLNSMRDLSETLYKTIRSNSFLASQVVRLTLREPREPVSEAHAKRRINYLSLIFPYLTHLKTFSCPRLLFHHQFLDIHPEIGIIFEEPMAPQGQKELIVQPHWWHRCHTLSFTYSAIPDSIYFPSPSTPSIEFPNLVNLTLNVRSHSVLEWLRATWTLPPTLRSLSITSGIPIQWSLFIEKCAASLEKLEILWPDSQRTGASVYVTPRPPITMPKLKTLCLSRQHGTSTFAHLEDPMSRTYDWYFKFINAPRLARISFFHYNDSQAVLDQVAKAYARYPTITEVGISSPSMYDRAIKSENAYIEITTGIKSRCGRGLNVEWRDGDSRAKHWFPAQSDEVVSGVEDNQTHNVLLS